MSGLRFSDPDLTLSELMTEWPETVPILLAHRMLCVGCLISPFHTVIDACVAYRLDEIAFRAELRAAIAAGDAVPRDEGDADHGDGRTAVSLRSEPRGHAGHGP